jgi:hypothetical protein
MVLPDLNFAPPEQEDDDDQNADISNAFVMIVIASRTLISGVVKESEMHFLGTSPFFLESFFFLPTLNS